MKKAEPSPPGRFAALLRGVNVGGRVVKMDAVRKAFSGMGFSDLKTIGASGNVLFSAPAGDETNLARRIEAGLQESLGMTVSVIVRSVEQLRALVAAKPFKAVESLDKLTLYVTFLKAPVKSKSGLTLPHTSVDKAFSILKLTRSEIFSVVDRTAEGSSIDLMELIEKEFGKIVTTRNWNTVQKLT